MSPIQTKWGPRCIVVRGFKLNGKDCLAFIRSLGEKETNVIGEPKNIFFNFETAYLPLTVA